MFTAQEDTRPIRPAHATLKSASLGPAPGATKRCLTRSFPLGRDRSEILPLCPCSASSVSETIVVKKKKALKKAEPGRHKGKEWHPERQAHSRDFTASALGKLPPTLMGSPRMTSRGTAAHRSMRHLGIHVLTPQPPRRQPCTHGQRDFG